MYHMWPFFSKASECARPPPSRPLSVPVRTDFVRGLLTFFVRNPYGFRTNSVRTRLGTEPTPYGCDLVRGEIGSYDLVRTLVRTSVRDPYGLKPVRTDSYGLVRTRTGPYRFRTNRLSGCALDVHRPTAICGQGHDVLWKATMAAGRPPPATEDSRQPLQPSSDGTCS